MDKTKIVRKTRKVISLHDRATIKLLLDEDVVLAEDLALEREPKRVIWIPFQNPRDLSLGRIRPTKDGQFNYYILEKETQSFRIAETIEEWISHRNNPENFIIKKTLICFGTIEVSTVCLGIDLNYFSKGSPIIFETVIFSDLFPNEYQTRCSTYKEALAMHKKGIRFARRLPILNPLVQWRRR